MREDARSQPSTPLRDRVVADVLLDHCDQPLLQRARQVRSELRLPHGLLVACARDGEDARALARAVAARLHRALVLPDSGVAPPHGAVVVPVASPAVWQHAVEAARQEAAVQGLPVLVREPVVGLRALRSSYLHAVADVGLALAAGPLSPLVRADDLVIPRMLVLLDAADRRALAAPLQSMLALPPPHRDAYLRTLDVLRRTGGSHARAAAELHLHANSLRYRIDRIEEMTGLRLADPADRLQLDLAVMLVSLQAQGQTADAVRDAWLLRVPRNRGYDTRWDEDQALLAALRRARRFQPGTYVARVVPAAA